jgi:hypothetical protein
MLIAIDTLPRLFAIDVIDSTKLTENRFSRLSSRNISTAFGIAPKTSHSDMSVSKTVTSVARNAASVP